MLSVVKDMKTPLVFIGKTFKVKIWRSKLLLENILKKKNKRRKEIIDQQEAGQASDPGSTAPGIL